MIHILIAEDDFRVASIHESFINKMGDVALCKKALNAEQALQILAEETIDLILLDNYMPDNTGAELLPLIRSNFPEVEIIMITAATEREVVEQSVRYGILDYLIKPVTFDRFQAAINKYLTRKAFFRENDNYSQALIDTQLQHAVTEDPFKKGLPKGVDPLTLEKVQELLLGLNEAGCTAEQIGERMGASRTTARRYLEYLISIEKATAELEYGAVGRPERKYYGVKK